MITRRFLLRTAGAAIALPFLESLAPRSAWAAPTTPKRFVAFYIPNGIHMAAWTPATEGAGYALPPILAPLAPVRESVLVLSGLANKPAKPDGPGDHASGTAAFLTAAHPLKTEGANIKNGVSLDQAIAAAVGAKTKFPSLQLGTEGGASAGGCDSGYSCAYARNVSWADEATPLPKLVNPQTVFDRLFDGPDSAESQAEAARRKRLRKSVLDHAVGEATRLRGRVGRTDGRKLDEYLTGVRELEKRLAGGAVACTPGARPATGLDVPTLMRTMNDLMVLALRCDLTRVITFMLGNAGSNRSYGFLGVTGAHHEISHHQGDKAKQAMLQTIDTWEVAQLADLLVKMKAVTEPGGGTLLDASVVFFSSEIEDGNSHSHRNLPVIVAGGAGGAIKSGRHARVATDRPIADLFLAILAALDAPRASFGDSTGALAL